MEIKPKNSLNGLAMMLNHKYENCATVDAVLTELCKTKRRRDLIFNKIKHKYNDLKYIDIY